MKIQFFIFGNFGKYWAKNLLEGRKVKIEKNDLIYYRFGYLSRFENSAFCLKDGSPTNKTAFEKQLNTIRKGKFIILDLDNDQTYPISKGNAAKVKNYVIVRKNHVKNISEHKSETKIERKDTYKSVFPVRPRAWYRQG